MIQQYHLRKRHALTPVDPPAASQTGLRASQGEETLAAARSRDAEKLGLCAAGNRGQPRGLTEAAGIHAVVQGIALATKDDDERVSRGSQVFDGLYGQLSR
jgi:hypothetical protein